ncbi:MULTISPECIES: Rv1733c family protein [Streptomyces]|uniref:Rv1733c family protein n=1 Tax=Streptomyces sp. SYP-A7185 TaxID=3040076 RepID=UPI0038F63AAD
MRALVGLWRWRHNPLRRKTDLVEAWVAFVAVLLIAVAAPLAGFAIGGASRDALLQSVREQREVRHEVTGTVVKKVSRPPVDPDPETASARDRHSRVLAEWTAPDGTAHSGTVLAALRSPDPGDRFRLWTDEHGQVVGRPLDDATAGTHAALAGIGAAAAVVGLVEGARRIVVWRIVQRRYDRWDQAWEKAGPDWGRTGTGS